MDKIQTFQEFLATQSLQIPIWGFVINFFLAAILGYILGHIYTRFGNSISNRGMFSKNILLITITTMFIISIVKSSLALSLGLVGALSIVRFRTAIKEPEELAYLFLAISIGLGLGADQRTITLVAFVLIIGIIGLKHITSRTEEKQNLYLTVTSKGPEKLNLSKIIETIKQHSSSVDMKRFDETSDLVEVVLHVEFENFKQLENAKYNLQQINDTIQITFLDNSNML